MQKYLYILCEGELDEMFYERIAERVTGMSFVSTADYRLRHGENWKTAMAKARMLLAKVRHWQGQQDVGVIIAVDNDRAPGHPGSVPPPRPLQGHDLKKSPRYPALVQMVKDALGADRSAWPVDVALAVPVEMIESWVLTLHNPSRADSLPIFAEASQHSARQHHGGQPPPQLKEMRDAEAKAMGVDLFGFFWSAAEMNLDDAAAVSSSLAMFLGDLRRWRGALCENSPA